MEARIFRIGILSVQLSLLGLQVLFHRDEIDPHIVDEFVFNPVITLISHSPIQSMSGQCCKQFHLVKTGCAGFFFTFKKDRPTNPSPLPTRTNKKCPDACGVFFWIKKFRDAIGLTIATK